MFGHKDVETTATVVAITDTSSQVEVNGKFRHDVVLDVVATDGPPFRVTTDHWFNPMFSPNPGDVVKVSYDPKSHKTKIHTDGDPRYDLREHEKRRHQEGDAAIEAAMAQPAGTAVQTDPYAGAQYDPELAELVALERGENADASISQPADVTGAQAQAPATAPSPGPGAPNRLQHLQMLRDSSLLTPEEFEILRKQLPADS